MAEFKSGPFASLPESVVRGSLADLGKQSTVYGSTIHNWQGYTTPFFFNTLTSAFIGKLLANQKEDFFKRL